MYIYLCTYIYSYSIIDTRIYVRFVKGEWDYRAVRLEVYDTLCKIQ